MCQETNRAPMDGRRSCFREQRKSCGSRAICGTGGIVEFHERSRRMVESLAELNSAILWTLVVVDRFRSLHGVRERDRRSRGAADPAGYIRSCRGDSRARCRHQALEAGEANAHGNTTGPLSEALYCPLRTKSMNPFSTFTLTSFTFVRSPMSRPCQPWTTLPSIGGLKMRT